MTRNPILEELYAAREQLLAEAGGNASEYLKGVRERERASKRLLSEDELRAIRCGEGEASKSVESLSSTTGEN